MSRIGKQTINVPSDVNITIEDNRFLAKGPKGQLETSFPKTIGVSAKDSVITVTRKNDQKFTKSSHGLYRSLINNIIEGVTKGYEIKLELHGVGFKAIPQGEGLTLNVGFSHPVNIEPVEGVNFKIEKNTILVSGIDKQKVGQVAANIRAVKKPEPYKGKGIRYHDEYIRRKPGKAAKSGSE